MAHCRAAHEDLALRNRYSLNNNHNLHPSPSRYSSQNVIKLQVCSSKQSRSCAYIEMQASDTVLQLKRKAALKLGINGPLGKLILEMYDNDDKQWKKVDDSNSLITIKQLNLPADCKLSVERYTEQVTKISCSLHSTPISNDNDKLIFKLCKKPLDKKATIPLKINSSSTFAQLRKEAYGKFGKLAGNQPIYGWCKGSWVQFSIEMDDMILDRIVFAPQTFISTDLEEDFVDSKLPCGLCGIINFGSTCFMNSIFQCLSNIPQFTERILALSDEIDAPIISEYIKLIKNIWSGKYEVIKPLSLIDNITDHVPHYANYRQQDAQEFMNCFLHLIHKELSTKTTFITDLFYGKVQSTVTCLECRRTEITKESISFLPLTINAYNSITILYVKTDGEQRRVSLEINLFVVTINDLIDCFVTHHEQSLTKEQVQVYQLANNIIKKKYKTDDPLHSISKVELAFLEHPKKSSDEKYIWCEFVNHSTGKPFRPPSCLRCPAQDCCYGHLSDQVDQVLGHLCSVTNAPSSAYFLYWIDRSGKQHHLDIEERIDRKLPCLTSITIEMETKWINIYKNHYSINDSNESSMFISLLDNFFSEDLLNGDYHCLKCSKLTKARYKSNLCLPLPDALTIQLKRFTFDIYSSEKIDSHISFPLYGLDLNDYIVNDNVHETENSPLTKYDLIAVVNHTGTLKYGHYTTYAKNRQDQNWYVFDDKIIKRLKSEKDVITNNAYILVYVKRSD